MLNACIESCAKIIFACKDTRGVRFDHTTVKLKQLALTLDGAWTRSASSAGTVSSCRLLSVWIATTGKLSRGSQARGAYVRTTPPYSPESNGMAEAFIKTFKRDYVWLGDLSSAERVREQLVAWFEDYNENAPHKALKMKSPRQYRRELANQAG